jgi:hypothetical protein
MAAARLASPGLLRWRAQIRQRNAAAERAARPIAVAEIIALAGTLLLAAVLAIGQRAELADWLSGLADVLPYPDTFRIDVLWPATFGTSFWIVLIASVATLGALGGLAAYMVARNE